LPWAIILPRLQRSGISEPKAPLTGSLGLGLSAFGLSALEDGAPSIAFGPQRESAFIAWMSLSKIDDHAVSIELCVEGEGLAVLGPCCV